ncbi:acyltransferase family protein [Alsobacter sp. SYSU BS001988]
MTSLPKHMPALDGLRGVAILMVILHHAAQGAYGALAIHQPVSPEAMPSLPAWLASIASTGQYGVELFFVVSAFTLTCRMSDHPGGLGCYALRRLARIAPGYWAALLGYTALAGLGPRLSAEEGLTVADVAVAAVFGGAWRGDASVAVVPGGWSVACEVAFYIALPLLLAFIDGKRLRGALLTVLAMLVAEAFRRHALLAGASEFAIHIHPATQAPVFLLGVTAALAARRFAPPAGQGAILALLATIVLAPAPELLFAACAAVVTACAAGHPPALLASRPMRRLGEVSYSMYLTHFVLLLPCLRLAEVVAPHADGWTLLAHYPLVVGSSFVASLATHRWIEKPFIAWAARLTPSRAALAPA